MSDVATPPPGAKRPYRSPKREEQAARTRTKVIDAAAELFSTGGYAGTTMGDISRAAAVSVESVHAVGGKATLLLEAFRVRYTGDSGWRAFSDVEKVQQIYAIDDPEAGLDAVVGFVSKGHRRSARLMLELRAVGPSEPEVLAQWDALLLLKREGWTETIGWMVRIGMIDDPGSPEATHELVATLSTIGSAETYLQLTDDWHMTDEQYRQWLRRQILLARV